MKKLLLVLVLFILTTNTSNAEDKSHMSFSKDTSNYSLPFINRHNVKTITLQQVKRALNNGANIHAHNPFGFTSLMEASMNNPNAQIIELLLQRGANINSTTSYNVTPLMLASKFNNLKVITVLLQHGANMYTKDKEGNTLLMFASERNHNPKVIEMILQQHGVDIEAKNKEGYTPLMLASEKNHNPKVIEMLLQHGANIHAKNKKGYTALMLASKYNYPTIKKVLLQYLAKDTENTTQEDNNNSKADDSEVYFIDPLKFNNSTKMKNKVIKFIQKHVKQQYAKIGMDSPSMLRTMEKHELQSFKILTRVEDKELLNQEIKKYCYSALSMCNYGTILTMYNHDLQAKQEQLSW